MAQRRALLRPLAVCVALAASIAPFVWYYSWLWGRQGALLNTWNQRFLGNLSNTNEYLTPVVILVAAVVLALIRRKTLALMEFRAILIFSGIIVALVLWSATVAITAYVRYLIMAAPAGAFLCAWFLVRIVPSRAKELACLGVAVLLFTPWFSLLVRLLLAPAGNRGSLVFRYDLWRIKRDVFDWQPDPNRIVIQWLAENAAPTDEILINYEDVPLMYYLPNPIRGGGRGWPKTIPRLRPALP